ncbi:MAG: NAD(P)H-dependent oxidoreductase [Prevotella sp.]|nr:NAD(P)H-dependent oxidoreductase [Prevotella sp.]
MKHLKTIVASLALLVSTACNGSKSGAETEAKTMEKTGKTLVVFFSHAGENYSVGNIPVGNTKIVADYISELTGADQFEIVADKDYDMPYMQLIEVAKQETRDGELPAYQGEVKNIDDYDTVIIGGPIWWGTYPQVMFTFFRDYDLNGKTVIPFSTHEGSGLGSVVDDVREAFPEAAVKGQFSIYGHEVRSGKSKVEKWLKGLGLVK